MSGINFIRKNLAVCGVSDIGAPDTLTSQGFNAQLQCAEGFDKWINDYVEVKPLPFEDAVPVPESIFEEAREWLSGQWDQGKKILISCTAGESRSVSMAIGVLHIKEKGNFLTISGEVCSLVRGAYPHPAVLGSVASHLDMTLGFDKLKALYSSIKIQPPFPWSDELLRSSLKP
jgi:hypothetical protein